MILVVKKSMFARYWGQYSGGRGVLPIMDYIPGLYGEGALPERGTILRLEVYKREGFLQ